MPEAVIRFGVGDTPTRVRASTWKCWTEGKGKKDVYLLCREVGGAFKLSLHESGQWHVAFASDNFPTMFEEMSVPSDRFIVKKQQGDPLAEGVRLACRIYTPWNSVSLRDQALDSKVTWIAPALPGYSIEFALFLCERAGSHDQWPARNSLGTQPLAVMEFEGGGQVWIVHRCLPAFPYEPIRGAQPTYFKGKTEADVLAGGNRMLGINTAADGSIVFHDLAVASVTKDQPPATN